MFDQARADEVIRFVELLKLTGDFHGKPFVLLPWQRDVLEQVYGTVREDGARQYRYAYLEIPKKNGKTELIATLGVYHLVCDGASGQIYCCAADRKQASLVFAAAVEKIKQEPALDKVLKIVASSKTIINKQTGTKMEVLSAEAYTKHGLNPTVVIFDELHAQPNRELWDVMTFGAGAARREPLWWVITTAGDDPDRASIGWEIHEQARKIRDGELVDPTWFVRIYGAPEDADIWDEATWRMANPSLGTSISLDAVRAEAVAAKNSPAAEKNFRWLRLNQWVQLKRLSWLPLDLYDANRSTMALTDLRGKRCYAGLDLSSTTDLTAIGLIFPPQDGLEKWVWATRQWIPRDNMRERVLRDHVPYDRWAQDGHIEVTPGDVIDYDYIKIACGEIAVDYKVSAWGNDPWGAEKLRQDMLQGVMIGDQTASIDLIRVKQDIANMSPAMKEMERLLKSGMVEIVDNPCTRWAFGNVTLVTDGNENYKPKKISKVNRIDPIVALINAMYLALKLETPAVNYDRSMDKLFETMGW